MIKRAAFLVVSWLLARSLTAFAIENPRLPYFHWNACPFECCTYRSWKAEAPVKVFKARNTKSEVVFELAKGQWVQALTGVVVTHRYGITKIVKPIQLGYRLTSPVNSEPLLSLQALIVTHNPYGWRLGAWAQWVAG